MAKEIKTTVEVGVEVTVLQTYTIDVDKSDPNWAEKAVDAGEKMARDLNHDVVTLRGEITDE